MIRPALRAAAVVLSVGLVIPACDEETGSAQRANVPSKRPEDPGEAPEGLSALDSNFKDEVASGLATLARAAHVDAAERTDRLAQTLQYLAERPSPDALDAARQAWLATRRPHAATDPFPRFSARHRRLSQSPATPAKFSQPSSETPDRRTPDAKAGEGSAEADGTTEPTGYHGIEKLLWSRSPTTPPLGHSAFESESPSSTRRRRALEVLAEQTAADARALAAAWDVSGDARESFLRDGDTALRRTVAGLLRTLDHLLERHLEPFLRHERLESLPSHRSGASRREIAARIDAVRGLYLGDYQRSDNSTVRRPAIGSLVRRLSPDLDRRIRDSLERARMRLRDLPAPLDGATKADGLAGPLRRLVDALETQRELLRSLRARLASRSGSVHHGR